MRLIEILNERQLKLCTKAEAEIENRDYTLDELYNIEQKLLSYLNLYCVDENDDTTELGEEYEDIIDKIVDFEDEINPSSRNEEFLEENDKVEMKDRKMWNFS